MLLMIGNKQISKTIYQEKAVKILRSKNELYNLREVKSNSFKFAQNIAINFTITAEKYWC